MTITSSEVPSQTGTSWRFTLIGGPTLLIEGFGLRLLTDPTFDAAGGAYPTGPLTLHKISAPALGADAVGDVDAVLLSHDQHPDNLDRGGRHSCQARNKYSPRQTGLRGWARTPWVCFREPT